MVNLASFLRNIARFGTLLIGFSMVCFTLCEGAINYGISIEYILWNLPNAIPYFLLLLTLLISWEHELLGGLAMLILGISVKYYLNAYSFGFNLNTMLELLLILFSFSFIGSWIIRKIHSFTLV